MTPSQFSQAILTWFTNNGRKDLPWQQNITPYRVWISEIMLQQTQVITVIPYYKKFMQSFPTVAKLASATTDEVLQHWAGLGYYARARNLHQAAQLIDQQGEFPKTFETIITLPGIGRSTAGAILALAYQQHYAILDGNVKRVLSRFYTIDGWSGQANVSKQLWQLAEQNTPIQHVAEYTQAIMDLGATLCTRKRTQCAQCPINDNCKAYQTETVAYYPNPKPKKDRPIKQVQMLLLMDKQHILLQQRPPSGIWGGLWSFPECSSETDPTPWCQQHLQLRIKQPKTGALLKHNFTHFQLHITPIFAQVEQSTVIKNSAIQWHAIKIAHQLALPKPISHLLRQLNQSISLGYL